MSRVVFFIMLFSCFQVSAQRRFEIWNKNQLSNKINERVLIKVAQKVQYHTNNSNLEVAYGEAFVAGRPKNWLEYGLGFRLAKSQPLENVWITENRTMFYADLSKSLKNYKLSFSNRIEYRSFKNLEHHFRYRQSLKLQFPKLVSWGMQFYTSEESYTRLNGGGTNLLRVYGGVDAYTCKTFKVSAYYGLQKAKLVEHWIASDILGLNLAFSI